MLIASASIGSQQQVCISHIPQMAIVTVGKEVWLFSITGDWRLAGLSSSAPAFLAGRVYTLASKSMLDLDAGSIKAKPTQANVPCSTKLSLVQSVDKICSISRSEER